MLRSRGAPDPGPTPARPDPTPQASGAGERRLRAAAALSAPVCAGSSPAPPGTSGGRPSPPRRGHGPGVAPGEPSLCTSASLLRATGAELCAVQTVELILRAAFAKA